MERIIIGQIFASVNVEDSIRGRLFSSPEDREKWFEKESKRLDERTKAKVLATVHDLFGGLAKNVKVTYSRKAGCGMCPCSPGWSVSAEFEDFYAADRAVGYVFSNPQRERLTFFVEESGRIDVRTHERHYSRGRGRRGVDYRSVQILSVI